MSSSSPVPLPMMMGQQNNLMEEQQQQQQQQHTPFSSSGSSSKSDTTSASSMMMMGDDEDHQEQENTTSTRTSTCNATSSNILYSPNSKHTLIQQYKNLRDEYLKYKLMKSVLDVGQSFNGDTFDFNENDDQENTNNLQQQQLEQRKATALSDIQNTARTIQKLVLQQKVNEETLQMKQDDLEAMRAEVEKNADRDTTADDLSVSTTMTDVDNNDDIDGIIDDETLQAEEDRLKQLEERKAELIQQQQLVYNRTQQTIQSTNELKRQLKQQHSSDENNDDEFDYDDISEEMLLKTKLQVQELQSKIEQYNDVRAFYDDTTVILEELKGVKIISVRDGNTDDEKKKNKKKEDDDVNNNAAADEEKNEGMNKNKKPAADSSKVVDLVLVLLLLNQYELEIGLQTVVVNNASSSKKNKRPQPSSRDCCYNSRPQQTESCATALKIVYAKYLPTAGQDQHQQQQQQQQQLLLPNLNSLVRMANKTSQLCGGGGGRNNKDSLVFLISEILMRIITIEQRNEEIRVLENECPHVESVQVLSTSTVEEEDGDAIENNNGGVGEFTEIVCTIRCPPPGVGNTADAAAAPTTTTTTPTSIQAVMRLTPDCPVVDGSVYLVNLTPLMDEDDASNNHHNNQVLFVQRMKDAITTKTQQQKQQFRHPIDLVNALVQEFNN